MVKYCNTVDVRAKMVINDGKTVSITAYKVIKYSNTIN